MKSLSLLFLLIVSPLLMAGDPKAPVIKLPPEVTHSVQKFDGVSVKELPYHVTMVKADTVWQRGFTGAGIKVGIVDTGVQKDHPGLDGKVVWTWNAINKTNDATDGNNHGTHVTGIVHSIAPDASIYMVKALSDQGAGSVDDIAAGIDALVAQKVHIISMSLGGDTVDSYMPPAIKRAIDAGIIVVAAAGNAGGPRNTEGYPGRDPNVISVAACDNNGKLASFSSWGNNVFTVDPGVDVESTLPGNRIGKMSGTSMATPVEAGKLALYAQSVQLPALAKLRENVISISPFQSRNNSRGYGLYTADKLATAVVVPPVKPPVTPGTVTVDIPVTAELAAKGVTKASLTLTFGQPVTPTPVAPPVPAPQPIPVQQWIVPGYWPNGMQGQVFPSLPYPTPQYMPGGCPGGVCPTQRFYR